MKNHRTEKEKTLGHKGVYKLYTPFNHSAGFVANAHE